MWANDLIISYSWWSIIPVLATGLAFAGILYFYNRKNKLSNALTVILFIVRFLSVSLLAFLLLSPYFKSNIKHIEKPVIIVGIDNSASMIQTGDSLYYKNEFQQQLTNTLALLGENAEVVPFLFGNEITAGDKPDFSDGNSDYGAFFDFVNSAWTGENTGLILLIGDGNYNAGFDPVYVAQNLQMPVISVAMGDTSEKADASIKEIRMNNTAFLNDIVPVEITFEATKLMGQQLHLTVSGFGKTSYSQNYPVKTTRVTQTVTVPIEAADAGKHRIQIVIDDFEGELNTDNNTRNIFLDVIESKQKVLLLAFSPHPDVAAIHQTLKTNKNLEVTIAYIPDFKGNPSDFDLVILHQLPAKGHGASGVLDQISNAHLPTLFILGNQSEVSVFNRYFGGLKILSTANRTDEAIAQFNPAFNLFTVSGEDQKEFSLFPPLSVPLGSYQTNPSSIIFCTQTIKGFATDLPLVLFYQTPERKTSAITGEGLWRWRMYDYLKTGNYNAFNTFLNKSVQFLISKTDRRPFKIIVRDDFRIFDPVVLRAECFNASFEQINSEEIPLTLINESGEQFQYLFSAEGAGYKLDLGHLPEGIYRYTSTANCQGKNWTETGEFVVTGMMAETMITRANHRILYQLAELHDGAVIYPNQLDKIAQLVKNKNLKSSINYETKLVELESMPAIFILLVFLLSFEWFIRKYFGTY